MTGPESAPAEATANFGICASCLETELAKLRRTKPHPQFVRRSAAAAEAGGRLRATR